MKLNFGKTQMALKKAGFLFLLFIPGILILTSVRFSVLFADEGTVTKTEYNQYPYKVILEWTSTTNNCTTGTTSFVRGEIMRVVFQPDATAVPLDDYDITLKDSYEVDVLAGLGSDLSDTNTFTSVPFYAVGIDGVTNYYRYVINDKLTLAVDNCGSNKQGTVILYLK